MFAVLMMSILQVGGIGVVTVITLTVTHTTILHILTNTLRYNVVLVVYLIIRSITSS